MDRTINLMLADDDNDDCLFFKEALEEIPFSTTLNIVRDGVELMLALANRVFPPIDVLFLDLNMPRKSGSDCLTEMKQNKLTDNLPVIIFSTSFDTEIANALYEKGAFYYIRKPSDFVSFKNIIQRALTIIISNDKFVRPSRENFVLNATF